MLTRTSPFAATKFNILVWRRENLNDLNVCGRIYLIPKSYSPGET
jgi:hypothetical protein